MYSMKAAREYQEHYHRENFCDGDQNATPAEEMAMAKKVDGEVQRLVASVDRSWTRIGKLCSEVHENKLWRPLGFKGFNEWAEARLDRSRRHACRAMRIVGDLCDVPDEKLIKMPISNAETLSRLPKGMRTEDAIEQAQTLTPQAFRERLN